MRQLPDLQSPVIATVPSGHRVLLISQKGDFWDVLKLQPIEGLPDSFGYIHKSRIQAQSTVLGAGCIRDADGWTNLRQRPSSSAQVVAKVYSKEWFLILSQGEFFQVVTGTGRKGFLHSSRVEWIVPRN
jgi:SH3-like domain-containing protein